MAKAFGAKADAVTAAADALRLAQAERYDIVLFEPVLPGIHGYSLVVALKRLWEGRGATPRFVALSGSQPAFFHPDYLSAGVARHLIKPITIEDFLKNVLNLEQMM